MALAAITPSGLFGLGVFWWVASGGAFILGSGPLTALLQSTIPNHLQGRALSLLGTLTGLAAPVGLALATPLGAAVGVRWLFVAMGTAGGVVALAGFLSQPLLAFGRPNAPYDEPAVQPDGAVHR